MASFLVDNLLKILYVGNLKNQVPYMQIVLQLKLHKNQKKAWIL